MKAYKVTLLSVGILTVLLIGAAVLNVLSAPPTLKLKVKWRPASITLDSIFPNPWNAEIFFAPPRDMTTVNPSTIRLEGMYSPSAAPYIHPSTGRLIVPFNGYDVLYALLAKAPHLSPGTYQIYLEITGNLYDGTPFKGSGPIDITVPDLPPP